MVPNLSLPTCGSRILENVSSSPLTGIKLTCDIALARMLANPNNTEVLGPKEAHLKSWRAHEPHAWISKVEYYDDSRMLVSCASDGQLVISDLAKGEVKVDGFRHRGEL